jgi:oligoribonuclease NrnB/cAMP/cGMP phosphodiesterase (DHH superfamily)
VWKAWGESARYVPITHDESIEVEAFRDALVAFVDIVPANEELLSLSEVADQIIVLDHHISSLQRYQSDLSAVNALEDAGHEVHFDLAHSGAALAWEYFHPDESTPELLLYVEDQDLWNWKLPKSAEVNAAIASYPLSFEAWSELSTRELASLINEGEPIVRANRMAVERAMHHAHPARIGGHPIEAVNSTSERAAIGHELAKNCAFERQWGCVYRIEGTTVYATLYSIGDLDVAEVAMGYGGGGHRNAAGLSMSLERWLEECV